MDEIRFSVPEILALIGVAQCLYLLVYMAFRSGKFSRAGIPFAYFLVLGAAMFSDFAQHSIAALTGYYPFIQMGLWFAGPPLSVLLVSQIAQITTVPALREYWVLLLIPFYMAASSLMAVQTAGCSFFVPCAGWQDWLAVCGLLAGALSLLAVWQKRDRLDRLWAEKAGKERYWLILAIVLLNAFFLLFMLTSLSRSVSAEDIMLVRTVLGLAFIYLVTTSLFRIYPAAVNLVDRRREGVKNLSRDDLALVEKIRRLLELEKVYHEPTYSRSDLARECRESETSVSRVINLYFQKSFPQLMNEKRIEDAKRLLVQTKASVKTVAEEVGFNSLATFNRVFREMEGVPPSSFRKAKK